MDIANRFHTPVTHALERVDYLLISLGLAGYTLAKASEVNWVAFWLLFWVIDVVGTFPALVAYYRRHRARPERPTLLPRGYHVAYNTAHSLATGAVVCALLAALHGGPEMYMTAVPLHLALDRSIFGNAYKPFGVSFQPDSNARFRVFEEGFRREVAAPPAEERIDERVTR